MFEPDVLLTLVSLSISVIIGAISGGYVVYIHMQSRILRAEYKIPSWVKIALENGLNLSGKAAALSDNPLDDRVVNIAKQFYLELENRIDSDPKITVKEVVDRMVSSDTQPNQSPRMMPNPVAPTNDDGGVG